MSFLSRSFGLAIGYAADRVVGEPPDAVHPMIGVGSALTKLESACYRDSKLAGSVHVAIAVGGALLIGQGLHRVTGPILSTALSVAMCSSSNMLGAVATEVEGHLLAGDLDGARRVLPSLVGRRPDGLGESEIARAVVESVAENTVDGVTATMVWALVGGAPLVFAHRITNTLDAMIGHRNETYLNFGWASAKLDDALNWVPARATALAVAALSGRRVVEIASVIRRDGGNHPSPNGGQIEAAVAAALHLTLGGTNNYDGTEEVRGTLGNGSPPMGADIGRSVIVTRRASTALCASAICVALARSVLRH